MEVLAILIIVAITIFVLDVILFDKIPHTIQSRYYDLTTIPGAGIFLYIRFHKEVKLYKRENNL